MAADAIALPPRRPSSYADAPPGLAAAHRRVGRLLRIERKEQPPRRRRGALCAARERQQLAASRRGLPANALHPLASHGRLSRGLLCIGSVLLALSLRVRAGDSTGNGCALRRVRCGCVFESPQLRRVRIPSTRGAVAPLFYFGVSVSLQSMISRAGRSLTRR